MKKPVALIAEHDEILRRSLRRLLIRQGCEVLESADKSGNDLEGLVSEGKFRERSLFPARRGQDSPPSRYETGGRTFLL